MIYSTEVLKMNVHRYFRAEIYSCVPLFIFINLFIDMLLLTVSFMIPAVYQYMLSQHRDVGSYLKLGGEVVMWGAKSASSCWNRANLSAKTCMGNCPSCPPSPSISYVPTAKVFRAILSSWKTFLWSLVWEAHKYVLLETCYWDSFASAMFLSNPKHALKIFYDLRILPIISQFVLRLLEILGYLILYGSFFLQ